MQARKPLSISTALQLATDLHQKGQLGEAERIYTWILTMEPSHFVALNRLAIIALRQGRLEEALRRVEAALAVDPHAVPALLNQGTVFLALKRYEDAVNTYGSVLARTPADPDAHFNLGIALIAAGRPVDAAESFAKSHSLRPRDIEALRRQADALIRAGRLQAAIEILDRAIAIEPNAVQLYHDRAMALMTLERHELAIATFNDILALNRNDTVALNNRGMALLALGRPQEAMASFDNAIAIKPHDPELWYNRSNALSALHQLAAALEGYDKVLALNPSLAVAHINRGNVLSMLNRPHEALDCFERALQISPGDVAAHVNMGNILRALGRFDEALAAHERALKIEPDLVDALTGLGVAQRDLNRAAEALASFDRAVTLKPDHEETLINRGVVLLELNRHQEALASFERVIALNPSLAVAHINRGNVLRMLNRPHEALDCFERALQISPRNAAAHSNRGDTLHRLRRFDEAVASHERAIALNPNDAEGHYKLGLSLHQQGQNDRASTCFDRALELRPGFVKATVARCITELPVLYRDEAEIDRKRSAYRVQLQALARVADDNPHDFTSAIDAIAPFFLPYQGQNDRDLQSLYGTLVCRAMARVMPSADRLPDYAAAGERVRVGIVSGYFFAHSNWKIPIKGWVSQLDRRRFQLLGYHINIEKDDETEVARAMFDRFVQGPLPLHTWRNVIVADRPHVLIYPEIGMNTHSLQLAAQRLAPVQCNSWGHPVTSGFPTIDYYLSSDLMEPADAEGHYTEKLILLPNLSIYYEPAETRAVPISREDIGSFSAVPTYWCGQSLYKYLPQNDEVFARIARQVGSCQFVFIDYPGQEVSALFRRRLAQAFGTLGLRSDDHCVFLQPMPLEKFLAAMGHCDVFLDSIGWSGCNSTLESLAHDLPIVTMAGPMMRGCHSMAILKMMGLTDTIASTVDDYVAIATRLGLDAEWRNTLRAATKRNKHRAYRDGSCIAALQDFLDRVARGESS
jgi:tetratricopeptide (TPR) repeat protein